MFFTLDLHMFIATVNYASITVTETGNSESGRHTLCNNVGEVISKKTS